jgi:hypothetical protein
MDLIVKWTNKIGFSSYKYEASHFSQIITHHLENYSWIEISALFGNSLSLLSCHYGCYTYLFVE